MIWFVFNLPISLSVVGFRACAVYIMCPTAVMLLTLTAVIIIGMLMTLSCPKILCIVFDCSGFLLDEQQ